MCVHQILHKIQTSNRRMVSFEESLFIRLFFIALVLSSNEMSFGKFIRNFIFLLRRIFPKLTIFFRIPVADDDDQDGDCIIGVCLHTEKECQKSCQRDGYIGGICVSDTDFGPELCLCMGKPKITFSDEIKIQSQIRYGLGFRLSITLDQ